MTGSDHWLKKLSDRRKRIFRSRSVFGLAIGVASFFADQIHADADAFKLIAGRNFSGVTLSQAEAADLFLGKKKQWAGCERVIIVDQVESSPVREAFSRSILGKSPREISKYWAYMMMSGKGRPPIVKNSSQEVLKTIAETDCGISYVAPDTVLQDVFEIKLEP